MRHEMISDIFKNRMPLTATADNEDLSPFLMVQEEEDRKRKNAPQPRYDLSSFMALPEIFPIFFEQTHQDERNWGIKGPGPDIRHLYFAFYYNIFSKEFKVLFYHTASMRESGFGVPLNVLEENSYTVKDGADFLTLKNTQDAPFIREHLEAFYRVFKTDSIKKTMQKAYNILDRMSCDPVHVYPQTELFAFREYATKFYKYRKCVVPIVTKFKPLTNVLNKSTKYERNLDTCEISIYKDGVIGFDNLNFITTMTELLPQYKITHRLQDWWGSFRK